MREGNLDAPTRHPLDWLNPEFYDAERVDAEMARIFEICHGCRRCVSLCNAFPTLFDLIDEGKVRKLEEKSGAPHPRARRPRASAPTPPPSPDSDSESNEDDDSDEDL